MALTPQQKAIREIKTALRKAIIHDHDLSPSTRLVGWYIADLVNDISGYAYPPQEYIADKLGLTIRTVQRAARDLAEYFDIEREEQDGRCKRYHPRPDFPRVDDKLSHKKGDKNGANRRQKPSRIGDKNTPLSYRDPNIDIHTPNNVCHLVSGTEGSPEEESDDDQSSFRTAARRNGCQFVFEHSKPFKAHVEDRRRRGILPPPIVVEMVRGKPRRGAFLETIWPDAGRKAETT
jgi:hypothetical protein